VETSISAITRRDAASDLFQSRTLANSTGPLQAHLSPAGTQVLLRRLQVTGGSTDWKLSLLPFDGAAETPIAVSAPVDYSWSPDGKRLVVVAQGEDGKRMIEVATATGRIRDAGPLLGAAQGPKSERMDKLRAPRNVGIDDFDLYARGAISWVEANSGDTLRFRERDGRTHAIGVGSRIRMTRVSPFDDAVIGWGWLPPNEDTLAVFQLDRSGTHVRTLFRTVYEGIDGMHWIAPGVVLMAVRETAYTTGLYRLDIESSSFTRLMTLPYEGAGYVSFSNDGRKMVTQGQTARNDVWVARVEW
jgi:dipeptidyl aminopeptidase/acylaminoacyl peptidase